MTDEKHQVVIVDGEMVAADDAALAFEQALVTGTPPVEQESPVGDAHPPTAPLASRGDTPEAPAEPVERDAAVIQPAEATPPRPAEPVGQAEEAGNPPADAVPSPRPAEPVRGELVAYEPPLDPMHMSLGDIGKVGRVFAQSGMFQDTTDAAQAIVKIMAGQELGLGPFAAMSNIDIIKGKPRINSNAQRALVQRHPVYDYRITTWTDERCEMDWYEGDDIVGTSSFSMEDAKRAGLGGDNWRKYPKAMLLARATSQGARAYAPAIFGGNVYAEGEVPE